MELNSQSGPHSRPMVLLAEMPAFLLPAYCAVHQAVNTLNAAGALHPKNDTVIFTFADIPAMDVFVYLGACWLMVWSTGTTIKLRGEAKTLVARQLLGFHRLLDIPLSRSNANLQQAKSPTLGVLALTPIATEEQQFQAVNALCAITHAAAEPPGVVCAQYRAKQQRFGIGICDMGRRLAGSLQPLSPRCAAKDKLFRHILSEKT
ncbi:hypothetical protein [Vulcanococcus sp. Clear-D1]|uniref:hypothetical protein n=1 Tax=Vulcanococcus sp. Clear-D1 TaxID=2766970 RepID=UPI0019ABD3A9|nr:hypothetical protein [Vulcanococcus sp. Clear-D1]MBD1194502.1 hypothetical protein [Vulcanococcus sp. Clear-D1]